MQALSPPDLGTAGMGTTGLAEQKKVLYKMFGFCLAAQKEGWLLFVMAASCVGLCQGEVQRNGNLTCHSFLGCEEIGSDLLDGINHNEINGLIKGAHGGGGGSLFSVRWWWGLLYSQLPANSALSQKHVSVIL